MWTPLRETPRIDEPEVRARGELPHYPPQKGQGFVIHPSETLLCRSPVRQGAWALGAWDRSAQNADQTLTAVSYTHPQSLKRGHHATHGGAYGPAPRPSPGD